MANRLSWSKERPDWTFFPCMRFSGLMGGWLNTGYSVGWSLRFFGLSCPFRDVGSPSNSLH